ncbi:MAG: hypothetical protein HY530_08010 [Chloroflexi bacterium]|nr:hypothetical protein [Chloroflexota bacterium]
MATAWSSYLDAIRDNIRLDPASETEIVRELESHVEDRVEALRESGLSEEEADRTCVRMLGSAKMVARQIYEAHSQGTWRQVLLASVPHLLFALLFVLDWWQHLGWLSVALTLTVATAIYGWWHGRPAWLFSWLGYSLLPVAVAGLFLLYLPKGWSWLAGAIYLPLAIWLLYWVTVQTIKRDWLYGSLMLLPLPVVFAWSLAVKLESGFPDFSAQSLQTLAPWVGLSFLALAATVATFLRLRQRWLKTVVVFLSSLLIATMIVYAAGARLGLPDFFFLILAMSMLFLIPALLERRVRHYKQTLPG